ncbi:MAG: M20/M25/M40 family metallo-hydrolase, partial [Armatimonadetes bacterium]|nr:M20/M25/M40 family metallo-hydrolase [Armatimonadota bacterium]
MNETQQKIMGLIDADEVINLAAELVRTPSIAGSEREVALLLARRAREAGLEVELFELRGYGVTAGRYNVVCRVRGAGRAPTLMLNGHLDTEPVPPGYSALGLDPFSGEVRDGYLYGLGTFNMKAALAAMVHAAAAIRRSGIRLEGDLMVAAVSAEMEASRGTCYLLEQGIRPDAAIVGEASDLQIMTAHTSCTDIRVTFRGRPTHVAFPERGRSVAPVVGEFLQRAGEMKITVDDRESAGGLPPLVNVSWIGGGYEFRSGLYLDECSLVMCVRGPRGVTVPSIRRDIEAFVAPLRKSHPGVEIEIFMLNPIPDWVPPYQTNANALVVRAVAQAHEQVVG